MNHFSNGCEPRSSGPQGWRGGRKRLLISVLSVLALIVSACATPSNLSQISELKRTDHSLNFLLMPLDVELSILTAGGMLEPQAEWTENAKKYMLVALREMLSGQGRDLTVYEVNDVSSESVALHADIEKLHRAVGVTILQHKYGELELPTKKDKFDWTLGTEASALGASYNADYGLFIFVRDSYSSGGRAFLQVVAAVAFGAALQGGQQIGFASLVDLNSGDVVWFNLLASATGDLRNQADAVKTVRNLVGTLPR